MNTCENCKWWGKRAEDKLHRSIDTRLCGLSMEPGKGFGWEDIRLSAPDQFATRFKSTEAGFGCIHHEAKA